jgi:hypothetical protein
MANKKRVSFRGKTKTNASKRRQARGFDYLQVPNGVEIFKPEIDTKVVIDFMPYEVTDKNHPDKDERNEIATVGTYWYKRPFKVHQQIGANNEKAVCPRQFGKPCPICDYRDELKKNDGDDDEIKSLYPKDRNLYAIMFPEDKKLKGQVFLFDISDYLFQEKFESQLQDQEEFDFFPDPTEGMSVKIAFGEGSFGTNKYAEPTRFDFVERRKQYTEDILDEIPKLDECFVIPSYEELKAKFFEIPVDEDEEEEEKPRNKKTAKKEKEPEEKEEEEEDEDKQPKNKVSKKRPEPEPEEEDDDEEEEEEEEELADKIQEASTIPELLAIAKEEKDIFKPSIKELREFSKVKLMKNRMLEILQELEAVENDDDEEEEDGDDLPFKEDEEEVTTLPKKRKRAEKEEDLKCPHGFKFGIDTDEYDECEECNLWHACYKKQQSS